MRSMFLIFFIFLQSAITFRVISGLYSGVTTVELDNLAAETAATMTTKHPDYAILAARIAVSNLHKETKKSFSGMKNIQFIFFCPVLIQYFLSFCFIFRSNTVLI